MNFGRSIWVGAVALAALFIAAQADGAGSGNPGGIWLTQAGDAKVRIRRCGNGLCGTVVWLRDPIDSATGRPQVDDKNENPSLRRRPIIGLSLFIGMRVVASNKWSGRIYNAEKFDLIDYIVAGVTRARSNEESERKSMRFSEVWKNKRKHARFSSP